MLCAETAASGTGTERIVERKKTRLDFVNREARDGAGETRRKNDALRLRTFFHVGIFDDGNTICDAEGDFETIGKTIAEVFAHDDAVHHHINVVFQFFVERGHGVDLVERAVHLDALKTLFLKVGKLFAIFAFAATDHRREQIKPCAVGQRHDAIDHLCHGLAFDGQTCGGRVRHADARPEEAHVVIDFRDRAHRRARIARGGFLLDGNGRRQAVDLIDIRLLHHLKELPRVSREAFNIAALAFGIDRVKRQRGLARARQAGDDDQFVARQVDGNVLEVVLTSAAHRQHFGMGVAFDFTGGGRNWGVHGNLKTDDGGHRRGLARQWERFGVASSMLWS